jgi:hypothetical protein
VRTALLNKKGKAKYMQKAGSISLVDTCGNTVYAATVFREYGSYRTTWYTRKLNGFDDTSLQEKTCLDLQTIQLKITQLMTGKLTVGVSLKGDFESLELDIAKFDTFDLQDHWYREIRSSGGKTVKEPLGLRSLVFHYFGEDIQPSDQIHDAGKDAIQTMRLFTEVYYKMKPEPMQQQNPNPSNYIEHFKYVIKRHHQHTTYCIIFSTQFCRRKTRSLPPAVNVLPRKSPNCY